MNVLLSIKPCYIDLIFTGEKKYEYRRSIFKRNDIQKILVYATSPIKKIIGEIYFNKQFLEEDPEELWRKTENSSGVKREEFFKYFSGKEKGYAIQITHTKRYSIPIDPAETLQGFVPPQSFAYIENNWMPNM